MKRSRICLINLSNHNIMCFLLVPLARLNLKTGFFQASWFHRFSWIYYDATDDSAFCFLCCKTVKGEMMGLTSISEASFIVKGFINWKDATRVLVKYESSNFHKVATEALKETNDVADISKAAATEKKNNRKYLQKIISSIRFLGCQGLPLRGDGPHNDLDSNFYQLLLLRAEYFQGINVVTAKKIGLNTLRMRFKMNYFQSCLYKLFVKLLCTILHCDDLRSYRSC